MFQRYFFQLKTLFLVKNDLIKKSRSKCTIRYKSNYEFVNDLLNYCMDNKVAVVLFFAQFCSLKSNRANHFSSEFESPPRAQTEHRLT